MATNAAVAAPVIADVREYRETREKVGAAGLSLINIAPHFGLAWAKMKPIAVVPSLLAQCKTWCVTADGVLHVNAAFTRKLSPAQATFVLGHEILHVVLEHFQRAVALGIVTPDGLIVPGKERELEAWGQATDMAINHALREDKVGEPPPGVLFPPAEYIATQGPIAAEPIYYWLLKNPEQQEANAPKPGDEPQPGAGCVPLAPSNAGQGEGDEQGQGTPGQPGQGQPGQGQAPGAPGAGEPIDWAQTRREIEALASDLVAKAGRGSGVATLVKPRKVRSNWKRVIRQGFDAVAQDAEERTRRTFGRLSRRQEEDGELPRAGKVGTSGTIAVVLDVSGSVSRTLVAKAAGETMKLAADFPSVRVILVAHTDVVVFAKVMQPGGSVKDVSDATGFSGGTDARPAYERVAELAGRRGGKGRVDALVHFTDCDLLTDEWPEAPAKRLVIGECGEAAVRGGGTKRPPKARCVPVQE